jgi:hypothetical protein
VPTSFIDYRGYRLATTSPKPGDAWTVMINPIEALPALPERAAGETREMAMEAARAIVDTAFAPRQPATRGRFAWLAMVRPGGQGPRYRFAGEPIR